MLIIPTWNLFNIVVYLGFVAAFVFIAYSDFYGLWGALEYSKFSGGSGLPSRTAMFILYFLPVVTAIAAAWSYLPSANAIQLVVFGAVIFHFAKRVLESLFLHKYSGRFSLKTLVMVAFAYSFIAGMICFLNAQPISAMDGWFYAGLVIFFVGEAGNFYHHKLLTDLRKNREGYHIPEGGLFNYVACPHYFFELIAWLGVVFLSRHLFALLVLIAMTAYLTERSVKTSQWYRRRFAEYPKERKCIIPFLY